MRETQTIVISVPVHREPIAGNDCSYGKDPCSLGWRLMGVWASWVGPSEPWHPLPRLEGKDVCYYLNPKELMGVHI